VSHSVVPLLCRRERTAALVMYISSNAGKSHLMSVVAGQTPSSYCSNYVTKQATRAGRFQLQTLGLEPLVEDEEQVLWLFCLFSEIWNLSITLRLI